MSRVVVLPDNPVNSKLKEIFNVDNALENFAGANFLGQVVFPALVHELTEAGIEGYFCKIKMIDSTDIKVMLVNDKYKFNSDNPMIDVQISFKDSFDEDLKMTVKSFPQNVRFGTSKSNDNKLIEAAKISSDIHCDENWVYANRSRSCVTVKCSYKDAVSYFSNLMKELLSPEERKQLMQSLMKQRAAEIGWENGHAVSGSSNGVKFVEFDDQKYLP